MYYWNEDSFGDNLPNDWEEVVSHANSVIDEYMDNNPEGNPEAFSEDLWEFYCENGF